MVIGGKRRKITRLITIQIVSCLILPVIVCVLTCPASSGSRLAPGQNQSARSSMELERRPFPEQGFGFPRGPSPFNMESMASTLPNYTNPATAYGQQHSLQQAYPTGAGQSMMYQVPSMAPFAGQTGPQSSQYLSFNPQQFPQQFQQGGGGQARGPAYPNIITNPHQRGMMPGPQQYQTSPQGHRSQGAYPPSFAHGGQPLGNMPMQMTPFAQNYPRQSGYNYMTGQPSQESYFLNVGQTGIVESTAHLQGERPRGKTTIDTYLLYYIS